MKESISIELGVADGVAGLVRTDGAHTCVRVLCAKPALNLERPRRSRRRRVRSAAVTEPRAQPLGGSSGCSLSEHPRVVWFR